MCSGSRRRGGVGDGRGRDGVAGGSRRARRGALRASRRRSRPRPSARGRSSSSASALTRGKMSGSLEKLEAVDRDQAAADRYVAARRPRTKRFTSWKKSARLKKSPTNSSSSGTVSSPAGAVVVPPAAAAAAPPPTGSRRCRPGRGLGVAGVDAGLVGCSRLLVRVAPRCSAASAAVPGPLWPARHRPRPAVRRRRYPALRVAPRRRWRARLALAGRDAREADARCPRRRCRAGRAGSACRRSSGSPCRAARSRRSRSRSRSWRPWRRRPAAARCVEALLLLGRARRPLASPPRAWARAGGTSRPPSTITARATSRILRSRSVMLTSHLPARPERASAPRGASAAGAAAREAHRRCRTCSSGRSCRRSRAGAADVLA